MIVVSVQALHGGAIRQSFNDDGITEFVGRGDDQFHAGHERDAELVLERFDIFPNRLL